MVQENAVIFPGHKKSSFSNGKEDFWFLYLTAADNLQRRHQRPEEGTYRTPPELECPISQSDLPGIPEGTVKVEQSYFKSVFIFP
jgi:hypothetical protein